MQNAIINVNGQITGPNEAKISVFDRGFLYGDSLYEVARTYHGKFFLLNEHLERLKKSAELCRMKLDQSVEHYEKEMVRTLEAFRKQPGHSGTEVYGRLIVTRGIGKIGFGLNALVSPSQYVIIIQPVEAPTPEQFQKGLNLKVLTGRIRNDRRALDPAMKSGNYLNNLLGFLEAAEEGYDDALLCNSEGHVTEGTTFNIFYVKDGIVITPPFEIGILHGITRRHVLEACAHLDIPVREARFPKERLYEADEVFVSSSVKEVFPVTKVDGKKIAKGTPGAITLKLEEAYRELVKKNS